MRALIERGLHEPARFRAALTAVARDERDAWLDAVLGLGELPPDGPDLPRDCVPYLPCSVDALLRMVDQVPIGPCDVVIDVGAGLGRAAALVHLLTGAGVTGLEIQGELVVAARDVATRIRTSRISYVRGDAAKLAGFMMTASVFFLYCPFSGGRLGRVLTDLEAIARTRAISVCCVDLPLPPCPWLALDPPGAGDLAIYRSTLLDRAYSRSCA